MAAGGGINAALVLFARFWLGGIGVLSGNALVDEREGGGFAANLVGV